MGHDVLCVNCGRGYKEGESVLKKSFKKEINKEDWCDDCIAESSVELNDVIE